ncbi:MAG TPA: hypothetical protein VNG53_08230 [Bacteroidia bacterium]|nr:hypothetical protein [Bacteroidia bacterium]
MIDPYYAYLMNGTNLAGGHLEIGHLDHPGTPVQCFAALVIFIKHLFFGSGATYKDVLMHPESYLLACNCTMLILFISVTFYAGLFVYRHTKNLVTSLLFQSVPLLMQGVLFRTSKLAPEAFIIIWGTLFIAYFYIHFVFNDAQEKNESVPKKIFFCGLFIGLLVASKFTCAVIILLPFIVIKGIWRKLLLLLSAAISFVFFIIPALPKTNYMFHWIIDLFTHEGKYGQGSEGFINEIKFKQDLHLLFTNDAVFTSIYVIIFVAFVISIIRKFKKREADIHSRVIQGIWIYITLLIILVAKHYNFYYLFPAAIALPLALVSANRIFSVSLKNNFLVNKKSVVASFLEILCLVQVKSYYNDTYSGRLNLKAMEGVQQFMTNKKNIPVIITSEYSSSFVEPALYFGSVYSGNMSHEYLSFLKQKYPTSYLYNDDIGHIAQWHWDDEIVPAEIFYNHPKVLVYFRGTTAENCNQLLNRFVTWNDIKLGTYEKVYDNQLFNEQLYQINADTALATKLMNNYQIISCNLENTTDDKTRFIADDGKTTFDNANQISCEEHYSGKSSIYLDKNHIYGLDCKFKVKPFYYIKATIWRKATNGEAGIVFADSLGTFYKAGGVVISSEKNGWEKIECACSIPSDYKEKMLHLYLYNSGKEKVYFDNVTILIYPMSLIN